MEIPNKYSHPTESDVFWGELAPCQHLLQIYRDDTELLDSIEQFVLSGLLNDESVLLIATEEHRSILELRLLHKKTLVDRASAEGRFLVLDAHECLSKFMRMGWPDEELFRTFIRDSLRLVQAGPRRVRAFGEMVAVLWSQGHYEATVRLEHLWNQVIASEPICLFCAYPEIGVPKDAKQSFADICAAHSHCLNPAVGF